MQMKNKSKIGQQAQNSNSVPKPPADDTGITEEGAMYVRMIAEYGAETINGVDSLSDAMEQFLTRVEKYPELSEGAQEIQALITKLQASNIALWIVLHNSGVFAFADKQHHQD